jgi:hypothetical protein
MMCSSGLLGLLMRGVETEPAGTARPVFTLKINRTGRRLVGGLVLAFVIGGLICIWVYRIHHVIQLLR